MPFSGHGANVCCHFYSSLPSLIQCRNRNSILFEPCRSKWLFSSRNQVTREDKALQEGELPPKDLERAEAAMRALIRIFLLLDFALVCLFFAS